jgi:hypothetical protein
MKFFLKGLNPFEIQTKSKLDLFPVFLFQNSFVIWDPFQKKIVYFEFIYHLVRFGNFWRTGDTTFVFCKFGVVEILQKNNLNHGNWAGPYEQYQAISTVSDQLCFGLANSPRVP